MVGAINPTTNQFRELDQLLPGSTAFQFIPYPSQPSKVPVALTYCRKAAYFFLQQHKALSMSHSCLVASSMLHSPSNNAYSANSTMLFLQPPNPSASPGPCTPITPSPPTSSSSPSPIKMPPSQNLQSLPPCPTLFLHPQLPTHVPGMPRQSPVTIPQQRSSPSFNAPSITSSLLNLLLCPQLYTPRQEILLCPHQQYPPLHHNSLC
jgi:hypothetical protein